MLMHANDRRVDHLHSGIVGLGQCAHELGPHARPSPANEAIVAGRIRTEVIREITPWRPRSQDPEDTIEDPAVIHSWHAARLVRQHRLDGSPFVVGKFVAHDSPLLSGGLNHVLTVGLNTAGQERSGRYVPESRPIMLDLSVVAHDPQETLRAI